MFLFVFKFDKQFIFPIQPDFTEGFEPDITQRLVAPELVGINFAIQLTQPIPWPELLPSFISKRSSTSLARADFLFHFQIQIRAIGMIIHCENFRLPACIKHCLSAGIIKSSSSRFPDASNPHDATWNRARYRPDDRSTISLRFPDPVNRTWRNIR